MSLTARRPVEETLGAKGANVCRWIINALGRIQRRKWVRALNHSDTFGEWERGLVPLSVRDTLDIHNE